MATYLFTWNPKKWAWKTLEEQILQLKNNKDVYENWGTGSRKHNIGIGDQFILIRLGVAPKGIIAIGTIASSPFEKIHWDDNLASQGQKISYVKLKMNQLGSIPFIKEDELNNRYPQINWTPQTSGTTVLDSIADEIFQELNTANYNTTKDVINQLEQAIINDSNLLETEKKQLVLSRIGQGNFRKLLIKYWGECCISGVNLKSLLIASHIKPWKHSNNFERLDVYNGLLLTPTLDRLFDQGLISFNDHGEVIYSASIKKYLITLNLSTKMKVSLQNNHLKYIKYHRENIFLDRENLK